MVRTMVNEPSPGSGRGGPKGGTGEQGSGTAGGGGNGQLGTIHGPGTQGSATQFSQGGQGGYILPGGKIVSTVGPGPSSGGGGASTGGSTSTGGGTDKAGSAAKNAEADAAAALAAAQAGLDARWSALKAKFAWWHRPTSMSDLAGVVRNGFFAVLGDLSEYPYSSQTFSGVGVSVTVMGSYPNPVPDVYAVVPGLTVTVYLYSPVYPFPLIGKGQGTTNANGQVQLVVPGNIPISGNVDVQVEISGQGSTWGPEDFGQVPATSLYQNGFSTTVTSTLFASSSSTGSNGEELPHPRNTASSSSSGGGSEQQASSGSEGGTGESSGERQAHARD